MGDDALIGALRQAVSQSPNDVPLRLRLASALLDAGDRSGAIAHAATALAQDAADPAAAALMARALADAPAVADPAPADAPPAIRDRVDETEAAAFDWAHAEEQVGDIAEPMFTTSGGAAADDRPRSGMFDLERATVRLEDVGGMAAVKRRLDAAFLAPLRNEQLRRLYGKSLRGGLLMYGPPGCGKTFIARAIAGELDAAFLNVGLTDVLDPFVGVSERKLRDAFELARSAAPCVLFLDELDAVGQRRSQTQHSGLRGVVAQLLTELDGADGENEGVFVLAATNQPWDVDPALRRPGRFDRTVLVLPPDRDARAAIFELHLRDRPIEGIDVARLAASTEGYSGADIAFVCEGAAERALLDSVETGTARLIGMPDLIAAIDDTRPSTRAWLESARNVVDYGEDDGTFGELRAYIRQSGRR